MGAEQRGKRGAAFWRQAPRVSELCLRRLRLRHRGGGPAAHPGAQALGCAPGRPAQMPCAASVKPSWEERPASVSAADSGLLERPPLPPITPG